MGLERVWKGKLMGFKRERKQGMIALRQKEGNKENWWGFEEGRVEGRIGKKGGGRERILGFGKMR